MSETGLSLYYYNHKYTSPIIFIITKINSSKMEKHLEENTDLILQILLEQGFANETDIMVFNVIKEHQNKIINWILPSKKSNKKILSQIEHDNHLVNSIVAETLKNINCNTFISFQNQEINIQDCDLNLSFLADIYF